MKCDDCLKLLEEYLDGETAARDAARVSAHLVTCAACAREFEALTAEQEVYARYDRDLHVSPAMWQAIAGRTAESRSIESGSRLGLAAWLGALFATPRYAFAGAAAVLLLAVVVGVMFLRARTGEQPRPESVARGDSPLVQSPVTSAPKLPPRVDGTARPVGFKSSDNVVSKARPPGSGPVFQPDKSGVLFTDAAYADIEDKETAHHVAQAESLLRSVRDLEVSDDDDEVDVSYEKAESRRLLNENVVLRRDAEMAGKFPVKKLLGELEPFLIDIANLPDKTTSTDLRVIKERVQKTEIVAALRIY